MGWEVLHDSDRGYFALMCNTADIAFGNLIHDCDQRANDFYGWWRLKQLEDPRGMSDADVQKAVSEWNGINVNVIGEVIIPIQYSGENAEGEVIVKITDVPMRFEGMMDMPGDEGYTVSLLLPEEYKNIKQGRSTYYDIPFNDEMLGEAFYEYIDMGDFQSELRKVLGRRECDWEGDGDFNGAFMGQNGIRPVKWKITRIQNGSERNKWGSHRTVFRDVEDKEYTPDDEVEVKAFVL